MARPMWIAAGLLAVACGAVGAVLPLVPTTPFLLLAAFAFGRSSPRLHRWLVTHKQFGPLIDNWNRHRAISRRTKVISVSVMAAMPLLTMVIGAPWWALVAQIAVLGCVAAFILSRRLPPESEGPSDHAAEILQFWFTDLSPAQWWRTDPKVDRAIRTRFAQLHQQLSAGVDEVWLATPHTAMAAVIVLDQFSRNLYRGEAGAFAQDAAAQQVAGRAIDAGFDQAFEPRERAFFYLPFMHAEDAAAQERCVELYRAMGDERHLQHALEHQAVITRFGRFPKRNAALGRESTDEEKTHIASSAGVV